MTQRLFRLRHASHGLSGLIVAFGAIVTRELVIAVRWPAISGAIRCKLANIVSSTTDGIGTVTDVVGADNARISR